MLPEITLTEGQRTVRNEVRSFVTEHVDPDEFVEREWQDDPDDRIPWAVVEAAADAGITGLATPEEFGGRGASLLEICTAVEELAAGDLGLAVIFDQNWKVAKMLDQYAQPDVREEVFEAYVTDPRHLLATASTEPRNGSNNVLPYEDASYDTVAERDGDEWVINGRKRYISNGADAKTYIVRAQTDPDTPHHLGGATAFRVPRETDGFGVSKIHEKMCQRTINNATLVLDDVRVHERNVLGGVGDAMTAVGLDGSHTEAGATAIGAARGAFEVAFSYANERVQGGTEIVEHQAIGQDFAEMAAELQAARSMIYTAARAIDEAEQPNPALPSMAKLIAAETAFDVSRRAMEKFGGAGIMLENPVQKYFRDAASFLHSDGTQTIHREKIIDHLKQTSG